jgi:23S rRNA pseudouridine1911/1915/1917 synthase
MILYEDDYLLALDKPAGMVVHPAYKHPGGTLLDAARALAHDWPPRQRPSIIGRLDKLTSGIVVMAKTADAHASLQRTLASPDARKEYVAIVYGRVEPHVGEIAWPLALDAADRRMVVVDPASGARCVTRFEVLARADAPRVGLSLVRCRLMTGRRHQIRVHLAASGWPIVGDPAYGHPRWNEVAEAAVADALRSFPRQALHAARVAFVHPATREPVEIAAPMPPDMLALLDATGLTG